MVVLKKLPAQHIIDGFKGTIDFYVHRGIACARKWPSSPGHDRSPAVEAQWSTFTAAVQGWSVLSPDIQSEYRRWAAASSLSGRDLYIKGYISGIYRYPKEFCVNPACSAILTANHLNLVNTVPTKLSFNGENFDNGGNYDTVNCWFLCPRDGVYSARAVVCFNNLVANARYDVTVYKNGAPKLWTLGSVSYLPHNTIICSGLIKCVAGDKLDVYVTSYSGGNTVDVYGLDGRITYFCVALIE